jgi:myosin heavy subunit
VEKLNYHFGSNKYECYSINRNNKHTFTIHHYAGKVSYSALGFLEKNRDTLSDSVVDMFKHSQDDLIRLLFHGNPPDGTIHVNKGVRTNIN